MSYVVPPPLFPKSRQSASAHDEFVIDNLVENGFVVSCMECLHVCNPLLVVTNASGPGPTIFMSISFSTQAEIQI